MATPQRKASKARGKQEKAHFEVGQRVQVEGYGAGTVIGVECQRGGRYSDVWVKPDDNPAQEIGVRYQHELVGPAECERR
jgi:3D (Asp-Asp-Asp) domain-containing protein